MAMIEIDHHNELIIIYGMVNGVIIPYWKEGRKIGVGRIYQFLETGTVINEVEGRTMYRVKQIKQVDRRVCRGSHKVGDRTS